MYSVGLDYHMRRSSLCILDPDGKQVKRQEVRGPWPRLMEVVDAIPRPFSICFEASCGYGHLHEQLAQRAACVQVAHPGQLRLIFRSKNKHDRIDAQRIAKLLYLKEVPQVHVPGAQVRGWRKLIEFRQALVAKRCAAKNQLRALLRGGGYEVPARTKPWSGRGRAWLGEQPLSASDRIGVDLLLGEIQFLGGQIKTVEQELKRIGLAQPGVAVLMSIPGVGMRTAEAVAAYLDDVRRFGRSSQVGAYFGLVPCQDSSAGRTHLGHITKDGPATVRKLLCEAVHVGARKSPFIQARLQRLMRNDPDRKKIAIVAAARWMAVVMAAMLRHGELWRHEDKKGRPRGTASDGPRLSPPEDTTPPCGVVFCAEGKA